MATLSRGLNQLRPVILTTALEVGVKVVQQEEKEEVLLNLAEEVQTRDLEVVGPRSNRSVRAGVFAILEDEGCPL